MTYFMYTKGIKNHRKIRIMTFDRHMLNGMYCITTLLE